MRFGSGVRPMPCPTIGQTRELTMEDLQAAANERGRVPAINRLRESHHRIARLIASGLRPFEVAELSGYTLTRISVLKADPAMQELIAAYRADVDEEWRKEQADYYATISKTRDMLARQMMDQVVEAEEKGELIPLGLAARLHGDLADRTGFGKRQTQVNINADFAAILDRAIKRSDSAKTIEGEFTQPLRATDQSTAEPNSERSLVYIPSEAAE